MFEVAMGILILAVVAWQYAKLRTWDKKLSKERTETGRLVDCCRTCTDYDCLVTCKAKRDQDREGRRR